MNLQDRPSKNPKVLWRKVRNALLVVGYMRKVDATKIHDLEKLVR
jgi:hypothetical protein